MNDHISAFLESSAGEKAKPAVTIILYCAAAILTVASLNAGVEIVFTHFYYIPIIVSAYWYRIRGVAYTFLLSGFYLGSVLLISLHETPVVLAAAGRVVMFVCIAGVVAVLSEVISRQRAALLSKNRDLLATNERLAKTESELRENLRHLAESERNLLVSREQIRLILESSAEGIYGIDRQGCITFINPAGVALLGYGSSLELLNKNADELIHHRQADASPFHENQCRILATLTEGSTFRCDNDCFRKKDGTAFPVAYCSSPLVRNGAIDGAVISFEDISERMEMLNRITGSLREKETLLKEIHHRVKNNLQIVASLLNMQTRYIKDEKVLDAIKESQNRVRAMALVHERLYQSSNLSRIDIGDYARFLMTNLFRFYGAGTRTLAYSVDMNDVVVDINTAIPLGLIFNELISNSLKYAFPDDRPGTLVIEGRRQPDGSRTIRIRDNGIGMPEGFDWKNASSLGLRLVVSLIEQVQGRIDLKPGEGTTWEITIPPERQ